MNKIIQINLSGQAVSIDEQAYAVLSNYLKSLEDHFRNTESGNEILEDIESRITELFFGKMKSGNAFITTNDVNEAIELMGTAEDMTIDEEVEENNSASDDSSSLPRSKKLFRNPDDKVISGTCSGIAAYFNVDASLIRIVFILLVFGGGISILPYIILWIAIPEAKTPHDKYRMNGDANTVSDIANNIRNEANNVASNLRDGANRMSDDIKKNSNFNSAAKEVVTLIERIVRFAAKIFSAGVLSLLVILGIAVAVLLLSNATGGININWNNAHIATPSILKSHTLNWIFSISLLSLILIPIGTVCYAVMQFIFSMTVQINFKAVFLAWLLSLAIFIGISIYASGNLNIESFRNFEDQLELLHYESSNEV